MKYVALTETMTSEEEARFLEFIKQNGWGYWHWLPGSWLLKSSSDTSQTGEIRDELLRIAPTKNTLVFDIQTMGQYYAGFGPQNESRDMFKWVKKNWIEDDEL